ncbi:MAG: hypothetical protein AAGA69_05125 [Pseudomonadota bacterium]
MTLGTITIDPRFRGPATSGNGGYVCGRLAAFLDGPAEVRLTAPPPLDMALDVEATGKGIEMRHVDTVYGMAWAKTPEAKVPAMPSADDITTAHAEYLTQTDDHALPHCFVCGPRREAGDALRIFAGEVPGRQLNADHWTPDASLGDEGGLVRPEFLWAALDCPSYFALRLWGQFALLVSLTAEIFSRPSVGEQLTVLAWPDRAEGRKHYAHSAILNAGGETLALANALWIEVNDPEFLTKLKAENE